MITKHNIQETNIHSFHNRLLGEATVNLELFLNSAGAYVVMRSEVTLTENFGMKKNNVITMEYYL